MNPIKTESKEREKFSNLEQIASFLESNYKRTDSRENQKEIKSPDKRSKSSGKTGEKESSDSYRYIIKREDQEIASQGLIVKVNQTRFQPEGEANAKDLLLDLNEEWLDVSLAPQTFYNAQKKSKGGEWVDNSYMILTLDGKTSENLEILTKQSESGFELAKNSIDQIELEPYDYFAFDFSDNYLTDFEGKEANKETKKEYKDRFGAWIEDDWERGVYTTLFLLSNSKNDQLDIYGDKIDLKRAEEAREVYKDNFDQTPEEVIEQVVYRS